MSKKNKNAPESSANKLILKNKKALFEYEIIDSYEAGIALCGSEAKSLRAGKVSLDGAFGRIKEDEAFIQNMTISPYQNASFFNHDPKRPRKLLLHKREIRKMASSIKLKGYTLVILSLYFKEGWAKAKIGLGRGKKLYDKREDLKKKDTLRGLERLKKY